MHAAPQSCMNIQIEKYKQRNFCFTLVIAWLLALES